MSTAAATADAAKQPLVFYVTGASKGIGKVLVQKIIAQGDKVAATSRDKKQLTDIFGQDSEQFLSLAVELATEESVKQSIQDTVKHFGTIDVIINNAGYAATGVIETIADRHIRDNFDINVFGVFNVLRYGVPILRNKKSGLIINISSVGGTIGFQGFGAYCATKFAVNGLTETLAAELKSSNVKVTSVEPGYFRTDFIGNAKENPEEAGAPIEEYKPIYDFIHHHNVGIHGKQRGDPSKLADILVGLARHQGDLPTHLYVGADSNEYALAKLKQQVADLEKWQSITSKTDFDE
ncbi:short-chain oxidoreductase [Cavenderia fasciculata]|uniref:Short-chain oxidoreductase n=1 Tax=Cavenderia fasciculata TaxID=261658 RepID=F4PJ04_CACFS|nr:short-chain oxidoreductase [Cavenderia fasciculata]EGG24290.1 short-chain oxidoreductase [Cavenderia fasciculata]|eukprot:XP_004362141.1 short-chain oxidoreductase [Cavenderia fasciculata]